MVFGLPDGYNKQKIESNRDDTAQDQAKKLGYPQAPEYFVGNHADDIAPEDLEPVGDVG